MLNLSKRSLQFLKKEISIKKKKQRMSLFTGKNSATGTCTFEKGKGNKIHFQQKIFWAAPQ